jgi:hypothetical protein
MANINSDPVNIFQMAAFGFIGTCSNQNDVTGGILVIDSSGDPAEFVITDPISIKWPTRILFGSRLSGYIEANVVAPAVIKSLKSKLILLCFDNPSILLRKVDLDIPVAVCAASSALHNDRHWQRIDTLNLEDDHKSWWAAPTAANEIRALIEEAGRILAPAQSHEPFARLKDALMNSNENI